MVYIWSMGCEMKEVWYENGNRFPPTSMGFPLKHKKNDKIELFSKVLMKSDDFYGSGKCSHYQMSTSSV